MTPTQRDRLVHLAAQMRAVAAQCGSLHGWWDPIGDLESCAQTGKPAFLKEWSPERLIEECERILERYHAERARVLAIHLGLPYGESEPLLP